MTETTIERVARELYASDAQPLYDEVTEEYLGHRPWEWITAQHQESYRTKARAVIAALKDQP